MRLFWEFSGHVPRLQADEQKQRLEIAVSTQAPDAVRDFDARLQKLAPDPITVTAAARVEATAQPDPDAFSTLRALQG
jgi:hypothetical protein